jgi:hypothetical protein
VRVSAVRANFILYYYFNSIYTHENARRGRVAAAARRTAREQCILARRQRYLYRHGNSRGAGHCSATVLEIIFGSSLYQTITRWTFCRMSSVRRARSTRTAAPSARTDDCPGCPEGYPEKCPKGFPECPECPECGQPTEHTTHTAAPPPPAHVDVPRPFH